MKTIKYLGGVHALKKDEKDVFSAHIGGNQTVNLAAGDEADVSDEIAAQVTNDFPGCFAIDGKTVGKKGKTNKADDPSGDSGQQNGSEDLAGQLSAHSRDELNAAAAKLGIEEPEKLPNKAAVVDAIIAAKNGNAE